MADELHVSIDTLQVPGLQRHECLDTCPDLDGNLYRVEEWP